MQFESVADLYDKIQWEGGVLDAIFSYGIKSNDLPKDTPLDIVLLWAKLESLEGEVRLVELWLEDNADDGREYFGFCAG
jgi:hypothetical protein